MPQELQYMVMIVIPLLLELATLMFTVHIDAYINKVNRRLMTMIIILVFTLIAQQFAESIVIIYSLNRIIRLVAAIYGYWVRPLVLLLCIRITNSNGRNLIIGWILVGINFLVFCTAFFSNIAFTIDAQGSFQRGPLGYTCHVVSGLMLLFLYITSMTNREFGRVKRSESWIPLFNALIIVAAVIMDFSDYYDISFLTMAMVNSCVFYYIYLHLQFVREHEESLEAEARMKIMISQIQPHFLYNTLATIQALCQKDPERASDITGKFGRYLRQNLESLESSDLVPIEKELEHTRIYSEIEMVRFPNVHVEYDIEDTDFVLPALTIQPMVENAIRYGVRSRPDGLVTVKTRRHNHYHEIVISDNGVGFNKKTMSQGSGTHIGIKNVRERVEHMCGGRLRIRSFIDLGTTVIIDIPDDAEENLKNLRKIGGGNS